jgi:23S rRNA (guanosine2251-2'-O)-methyltransferase
MRAKSPERKASAQPAGPPGQRRSPPADDPYLYGLHAVAEAWANPERRCVALAATPAGLEGLQRTLAGRPLPPRRPAPRLVERGALERLLPAGAVHQGLALEVAPLPETSVADLGRAAAVRERTLTLVLDQVTDPHNVGAVLRSAAAFGALALVVTDRHAPRVTGALAKSASGAVEHVPIVRVGNLARALGDLKAFGIWCVGLDEEAAAPLADLAPHPHTALVLGAEGEGLRRLTAETCDALARLPTRGALASLNVSNAAAIALYELAR